MKKEKYLLFLSIIFLCIGLAFGLIASHYYSLTYRSYDAVSKVYYFLMGVFLYAGVVLLVLYYIFVNIKNKRKKLLFSSIALFVMIFLMIFRLSTPLTYSYISSDGRFQIETCPGKGISYNYVQDRFKEYFQSAENKDVYLCRTFSKKWYDLFGWPWYLFHPRWKLPYKYQQNTD
ncbi:MAG: hypothetical protein A2017_04795 [Lentisphaerae bacterium GWF2_44_16]|nr:MAG: hypothetical protein A2017_04795 [Lentisphaerae bacterium GWF2_44_16]